MFPLPSGERIKVRGKSNIENQDFFKLLNFLVNILCTKLEKSRNNNAKIFILRRRFNAGGNVLQQPGCEVGGVTNAKGWSW
jgi:hypothetical protein